MLQINIYKIYLIVNKLNNKIYVGCTYQDFNKRISQHLNKVNNNSQLAIHRAIRKYKINNFSVKIIQTHSSKESMLKAETLWISYFNSFKSNYGYNETTGGIGGNTNANKKFNSKWKNNISIALSGSIKINKRKFSNKIEKEILNLYENNISMYKIAKLYKCYASVIKDVIIRNNLEIRHSVYNKIKRQVILSVEHQLQICDMYKTNTFSITYIAIKFHCGRTTVRDVLIKYKVNLKRIKNGKKTK